MKTDSLFEVSRTWWLGDLCGALVVVPLAIAWWPLPRRRPALDRHLVEGALLLVVVATLAEIAAHSHQPVAYLLFPALIWAAVRFGARGATLAVAAAVSITVWATTHFEGPFVVGSSSHSVVNTQLFVAVAAVSSLCLAALVAERELFAERLGESRAELYRAAETERRRIERALHDGAQQRLLALGLRLHMSGVRAVSPDDSASFFNAETQLQAALDELRELSHGTHPSVLSELGLAGAIASVAARSTIPVTLLELPSCAVRRDGRGNRVLRRQRGDRERDEALACGRDRRAHRDAPGNAVGRDRRRRRRRSIGAGRVGAPRPARAGRGRGRDAHALEPARARNPARGDRPRGDVTPPVRVLLVDDSPVFLEAAAEVIDGTPGFELAATGTSGEEAVELAASLRPELVLVDHRMPGMTGVEAASRIRAGAPATVIAILTADSGTHSRAGRLPGAEQAAVRLGRARRALAASRRRAVEPGSARSEAGRGARRRLRLRLARLRI